MGLFDSYRINRAVAALLAASDEKSPEAVRALATLKRFGQAVIPRLIDALAQAPHARVCLVALQSYVQNATLPLFGEGLASTNARVVAGVVEVLSQATTYDANRLLDFWTDTRIPKATLGKLLVTHETRLDARLLLRCLDTARPEDRAVLLSLLAHLARVELVPALTRQLTHRDEAVRLALVPIIARFQVAEVHTALLGLLADAYAPVRQAALEALGSAEDLLEVKAICRLLNDDDRAVRRQARALLAQRKDPRTVSYLFDILSNGVPERHQSAIELLQVVGTAEAMQALVVSAREPERTRDVLLSLLTNAHTRVRHLALAGMAHLQVAVEVEPICRLLLDQDATVRRQATAILIRQHDAQLFPLLLPVLQDESPEVQLNAVLIVNALGDSAILKTLLEQLQDQDWWVAVRVAEALGRHGNARVITATLQLVLDPHPFYRRCAVEILKLTRDEQVVPFLLNALEHATTWVKTCAAETLAALGDKRAVPTLLHIADVGEPAERVMAFRTLTTLGDPQALPVCLAQAQHGVPEVQQEALQSLVALTDAEHAEAVLQVLMTLRTTVSEPGLKTRVNSTATALIRRFGDKAVGHSQIVDMQASRLASPSLLQEMAAAQPEEEVEEISGAMLAPEISSSHTSEALFDPAALEPGTVLEERYRVIRNIGRGGFGTVVLVEDLMVHEQLILKFLYPHLAADEHMIARFVHELRYARRVTHENVIRIHDFLKVDQAYAISMEYFPSQSLSDELRSQEPLPLPRALWIAFHVCRGMHAAHHAQIIHRDLKPGNILINDAGLVKIVDFGLAAVASDTATRLTKTGSLLGTPLYMAPEQVQNRTIDARSDIYSLGVIIYEMFTGLPPYRGDNPMSVLFQHVAGKVTPPRQINAALPQPLEAIILQAMAVEPEKRFQSMDALGKQLAGLYRQYAH